MNNTETHPRFLVSTEWLSAHLDDPKVRILDPSTLLPPKPDFSLYDVVPAREDFEKGHIPHAVFVDVEHELSKPDPKLHFMLPDAQTFADAMSRYGVSDDSFVVTYSTTNHWWATRLWWMLRVFGHQQAAVLDGGFQKWQAEGRAIETGPAQAHAAGRFSVREPNLEMVARRDDVLAAIKSADTCTINALRPEQHAGTGGVNYGRRGHITGSVSIPALHHVNDDNTFKSEDELRSMFADAMRKPEVITYCGGGIAATSVALALEMLGYNNVKVYDASLTEWAADPELPMEI
ncbi:MAG: sulfurtransferase [Betaproteobacteria bacterium]|nr:MAG: sulfurtransferase [Betaproteobacteria bacterium]